MDFSFSDEQQMLRDGVGKFLEKHYDFDARHKIIQSDAPWSAAAWAQYAEFGLLALPFTEDQGGLGGSIVDCVAFAELFGKHLTVEPYTASVVLAGATLAASDAEVARQWLAQIISGEQVVAFAYEEGNGTAAPDLVTMSAQATASGHSLSGTKVLVHAAAQAGALVVVARQGDSGPLAAFLVERDAPGMIIRSYQTVDGRDSAMVVFEQVDAQLLEGAEAAIPASIDNAIIVQSAEAVGAMDALLALTAEYASTRKQFGAPIASFQAIAHRLADMKIACTKARATLLYTTALAASGIATARDIAVLKSQMGKLGQAVGESAIQIHGGVGTTDELSIGHYHKRLLALDAQFGSAAFHMRKLGTP